MNMHKGLIMIRRGKGLEGIKVITFTLGLGSQNILYTYTAVLRRSVTRSCKLRDMRDRDW
jgi:hypothetical protein